MPRQSSGRSENGVDQMTTDTPEQAYQAHEAGDIDPEIEEAEALADPADGQDFDFGRYWGV